MAWWRSWHQQRMTHWAVSTNTLDTCGNRQRELYSSSSLSPVSHCKPPNWFQYTCSGCKLVVHYVSLISESNDSNGSKLTGCWKCLWGKWTIPSEISQGKVRSAMNLKSHQVISLVRSLPICVQHSSVVQVCPVVGAHCLHTSALSPLQYTVLGTVGNPETRKQQANKTRKSCSFVVVVFFVVVFFLTLSAMTLMYYLSLVFVSESCNMPAFFVTGQRSNIQPETENHNSRSVTTVMTWQWGFTVVHARAKSMLLVVKLKKANRWTLNLFCLVQGATYWCQMDQYLSEWKVKIKGSIFVGAMNSIWSSLYLNLKILWNWKWKWEEILLNWRLRFRLNTQI